MSWVLFSKNLSGKEKQRNSAIWNMLHLKQILSAKLQSLAVVEQTGTNKIIKKSSLKSRSLPMEIRVIHSNKRCPYLSSRAEF